ncbi:hypothetical protein AQJ30_07420 [Streptomyces longwoodensis]|uniref:Uncharacterized protein n=1 Tax=Streptomyces longwoodensis TaxID=68231 RepID=A0A117QQ16_9ACTN|nr:hypothetical protein [Streptomyces longwoodensis]KUN40466.1 hypothetical protein AQJ30_07420 [Streptomyces longwoodensis]
MQVKKKWTRTAGITAAGLCLTGLGVIGGIAIAAPSGSQAPYARAGALVNADGTVVHSKNVSEVTKPAGHNYCVRINDDDIDLSRALVTATPRDGISTSIRAIAGGCANGRGVLVGTYDTTNHGRAAGFYLAVL